MESRIGMLRNEETNEGTFRDAEFMCMTREFAQSLKPLVNDRIGKMLLQFFEDYDKSDLKNNPETMFDDEINRGVNILREEVESVAIKMTLHLRVKDTNIFRTIYNLNLESAIATITNRQETLDALKLLYENRDAWVEQIPARKKEDYVEFRKQISKLQEAAYDLKSQYEVTLGSEFVPPNNPYLSKCIDACKSYFYEAREVGSRTGVGILLVRANDIEMLMNGLEYQIVCDSKRLTLKARREIPIC